MTAQCVGEREGREERPRMQLVRRARQTTRQPSESVPKSQGEGTDRPVSAPGPSDPAPAHDEPPPGRDVPDGVRRDADRPGRGDRRR
eukprot:11694565-Alexandrium_andersonii.AAC.1